MRIEKDEERKPPNQLFVKIRATSQKGFAAEAYWKKVYENKKAISDENYAMVAGWLSEFHRGNMNALSFYEHMDRQMSFDEMKAIFRDIQFTHKTFGWD